MTADHSPAAEDALDVAAPTASATWRDARRLDAGVWHLGWALAFSAMCGLELLLGLPRPREVLTLAMLGAPGLAAWPLARRDWTFGLPLIWAIGGIGASVLAGGPLRPVGALALLAPLIGAATVGEWGRGLLFSLFAAALSAGLIHVGHAEPGRPGSLASVLGVMAITAAGAVAAAILCARRTTPERGEADRDLADELARLEQAVGDLPDLAFRIDAHDRADVVFGRALDGVDPADLHQGVSHVFQEAQGPALAAALAKARAEGFAEADLTARGGRRLRLSLNRSGEHLAAILRPAPDPAPSVAAAPVDASLRAELTAAVAGRETAEGEARSRAAFLANMSHELRTPLNAIVGFSDIMRSKLFGPMPDRYAEYSQLIHESGGHLLDLINDVLDISKIEADRFELRRERMDARDPVNAALRLMRLQADEAGVRLRASLPSDALVVDADARALKQITLNLLSNALKFTPRGGEVDLSLGVSEGEMELTVADTGVGVSAEDLERLGRPYVQAQAGQAAGGTGLGLSLVKAMAAMHGGRFILESRLGDGAAATVRLPVLAA